LFFRVFSGNFIIMALHDRLKAELPDHWRAMIDAGATLEITRKGVRFNFPREVIRITNAASLMRDSDVCDLDRRSSQSNLEQEQILPPHHQGPS